MNAFITRFLAIGLMVLVAPVMGQEVTLTMASVEVEDGDTLVVEIDGAAERVQLAGIDAPEDSDNAKFQRDLERTGLTPDALLAIGAEATAHLRSLVERGGPFALTYNPAQRDRYGRILAEVSGAGAGSLNVAMLEEGYAVVLAVGEHKAVDNPRFGLQRDAIATRRGIWGGDHRDTALAWRGSAK